MDLHSSSSPVYAFASSSLAIRISTYSFTMLSKISFEALTTSKLARSRAIREPVFLAAFKEAIIKFLLNRRYPSIMVMAVSLNISDVIDSGSSSVEAPRKVNMERCASGVIMESTLPVGELDVETRGSTLLVTSAFLKFLP